MQEISEATLLEKLNEDGGTWKEVPFPEDKVPDGHTATSIQGNAPTATWLVVRYTLPDGTEGFDGTCVIKPFTFVHIPATVAKAAFLKGSEWLRNQKA